jgi:hypothetical protein
MIIIIIHVEAGPITNYSRDLFLPYLVGYTQQPLLCMYVCVCVCVCVCVFCLFFAG